MHLLVRLSAASRLAFPVSTAAMLAPLMLLASTSPVLAQPAAAPVTTATAAATDITAAVRRAADAYATAFNAGDDKALGDQWTLGAELEEGGTLLDHTQVLCGSSLGNASAHSNTNLPVLLAGGGYRHPGHLAFDERRNEPLANLYLTMLQRLGLDVDSFASSTGTIRGLDN